MKYNRIPALGAEVSQITFGCWELGGGQWEKESDDTNLQVIEEALKLGINSFDTAEGYGQGHSEEIVGEALQRDRKNVVLATKVAPDHLHAADVRKSIEASLKRLRTDFVDIYYIHWPSEEIPISETMAELQRIKEEGLIRCIAASNFSRDLLAEAEQVAKIDVIQPEYSLLYRSIEREEVPYCVDHDIAIMSYSSIAKGILTGIYHLGSSPRKLKENDFRQGRRLFLPEHMEKEAKLVHAVKEIADAHNVTPSEIAIAWLLQQPGVTSAIVGTQNLDHLRQNVKAVDVTLTPEEASHLDKVSRETLVAIDGQY